MNAKILAPMAVSFLSFVAMNASYSQTSSPSHSSSNPQAKGPLNQNPVALSHHPNDPRYRPHPSGGRPTDFDRKYARQAAMGQT